MAITRVQATGRFQSDNVTSDTKAINGVTAGNDLFVLVSANRGAGVNAGISCSSDVNGAFSKDIQAANGATRVCIFRLNAASAGTHNVTINAVNSGTWFDWCIIEFSGAADLTLDKTSSSTGSSATPTSGATATTSQAAELILGVCGANGSEASITVESTSPAWTEEFEELSFAHAPGEGDSKIVSSTAAYTANWTLATSRVWSAIIATYYENAEMPVGSVTLTGLAATVLVAGAIAIPAGAVTLTGLAATVKAAVPLPAGSLALTGLAPILTQVRTIPAGAVAMTGRAPSIVLGGNFTLAIPAGAIALTGQATDNFRQAGTRQHRLEPDIFIRAHLTQVPASSGLELLLAAFRPLAAPGAFYRGSILEMSDITRKPSDFDGQMQFSPVTVTFSDADGFWRRRLAAGAATEYFINRQFDICCLSEQGREDALEPVILRRGFITKVKPIPGRRVSVEIGNALEVLMTNTYVDQTIGTPIGDEQGPTLPASSRGEIYPYLLGDGSDRGMLDANGEEADVGVLPVIEGHTGQLPEDPTDLPGPAVTDYLDPPVITAGTVHGAGTTTRYYQATALSAVGETRASSPVFEVDFTAGTLNADEYVDLEGTCDADAAFVRVYGGKANPPTRLLGQVIPTAGAWAFQDDNSDDPIAVTPPPVSTAINDPLAWTFLIAGEGALTGIPQVYASDGAELGVPKRVRQPENNFGNGGELLAFGHQDWPYETSYVEVGGKRQTGIFARGLVLDHHRRNIVTITVNYCGQDGPDPGGGGGDPNDPDAQGDGTNPTIDQALPMLRKTIQDLALKDRQTFENGDRILDTNLFDFWQDATKDYMEDDYGYFGTELINKPITLGEYLRRWNESFGGHITENRHGQIRPFFVDWTHIPATVPFLRWPMEIDDLTDQDLDWGDIKVREEVDYNWSAAKDGFLIEALEVRNEAAAAAIVPDGEIDDEREMLNALTKKRQCHYVNEEAVAETVSTRALLVRGRRLEYATLEGDLRLLQVDIGEWVRWAHPDRVAANAGPDYTPTDPDNLSYGQVWEHTIIPSTRRVRVKVLDLSIMLEGSP